MTLEEYLLTTDEAIEDEYRCPISGAIGPAFSFVWTSDDASFDHDYVHSTAWLNAQLPTAPEPAPSWSLDCEIGNDRRAHRQQLLSACDWTQTVDAPLSPEAKAEWAAYRQALRDITEAFSSPDQVIWPTKPLT